LKTYEYTTVLVTGSLIVAPSHHSNVLSNRGADGWRVVCSMEDEGLRTYLLEREREDPGEGSMSGSMSLD
jgi:hypothetical protein